MNSARHARGRKRFSTTSRDNSGIQALWPAFKTAVKSSWYAYIKAVDLVNNRFIVTLNESAMSHLKQLIDDNPHWVKVNIDTVSICVLFTSVKDRGGMHNNTLLTYCCATDTLAVTDIVVTDAGEVSIGSAIHSNLFQQELKRYELAVLRPRVNWEAEKEGENYEPCNSRVNPANLEPWGVAILPYAKGCKAYYHISRFAPAQHCQMVPGAVARVTTYPIDFESPKRTQHTQNITKGCSYEVADAYILSESEIDCLTSVNSFYHHLQNPSPFKFVQDFVSIRCCILNNEDEQQMDAQRNMVVKTTCKWEASSQAMARVTLNIAWPMIDSLTDEESKNFFAPSSNALVDVCFSKYPDTKLSGLHVQRQRSQLLIPLSNEETHDLRKKGVFEDGKSETAVDIKPYSDASGNRQLVYRLMSIRSQYSRYTSCRKNIMDRYLCLARQPPTPPLRVDANFQHLPKTFKPNQEQARVIQTVMDGRKTVIPVEGPPGAGKSQMSVGLVYSLVVESETVENDGKIFAITSESNTACDNACQMALTLHREEPHDAFRPLRVYAKTRESIADPECRELSLHVMVTNPPALEKYDEIRRLADRIRRLDIKLEQIDYTNLLKNSTICNTFTYDSFQPDEETQYFTDSDDPDESSESETETEAERPKRGRRVTKELVDELIAKLDELRKKIKVDFIKIYRPNIIFATLATILSDEVLAELKYDGIVVDEVGHCMEAKLMPSLTLLPETSKSFVVLIGDRQQLSPMMHSSGTAQQVGGISALERLESLGGVDAVMLRVLYRSHPALTEFVNREFYNNSMINSVVAENRQLALNTYPFNCESPLMWVDTEGVDVKVGKSRQNLAEVGVIARLITLLVSRGAQTGSITVISMYANQKSLLTEKLRRHVEIATTDSMLGRQTDITILSTVRCCAPGSIRRDLGYLSDVRRLNVAITRARHGVFIVGSKRTMAAHPAWSRLIKSIQDKNNLVEAFDLEQRATDYDYIGENMYMDSLERLRLTSGDSTPSTSQQ